MTVDYLEIGQRIRKTRKDRGLTQEQLAELVDVGTTHISHIETGNTIPSLKLFISIANALEVSADELLCSHLSRAKAVFETEIQRELADCTSQEIKLITDIVRATKGSLRRLRRMNLDERDDRFFG